MKVAAVLLAVFAAGTMTFALNPLSLHQALAVKRELPGTPQECLDRCNNNSDIYDRCLDGDTDNCLSICEPQILAEFQDCFQCFVDQAPQDVKDRVVPLFDQIKTACDAQISGSASPTGSATSTASSSSGQSSAPAISSDSATTSGAAFMAAKLHNFVGGVAALVGMGVGAVLVLVL